MNVTKVVNQLLLLLVVMKLKKIEKCLKLLFIFSESHFDWAEDLHPVLGLPECLQPWRGWTSNCRGCHDGRRRWVFLYLLYLLLLLLLLLSFRTKVMSHSNCIFSYLLLMFYYCCCSYYYCFCCCCCGCCSCNCCCCRCCCCCFYCGRGCHGERRRSVTKIVSFCICSWCCCSCNCCCAAVIVVVVVVAFVHILNVYFCRYL